MQYDEQGNFRSMSDRQVVSATKKWIVGGIVAMLLVSLVGWQVGWWFKAENTKRQVNIDNLNKGTQTAWHDEVVKTIADFNLVDQTNTAARGALRNKACELIPRLSDPYRGETIDAFYTQECQ